MLNAWEDRGRNAPLRFWVPAALLFAVAVALRWARLDFMAFSFDHAALAFRAMEAREGNFPFTGIVNSLGFRNAPGYVWTLLPAFVVTASPMVATAWHGLLSATMVFPLALLGRRFRGDALAWLPAVLGAVLPISVFAGRDIWAQHLLPPLAAWTLLWLLQALDIGAPQGWRLKRAALCLAAGAWAVSVHFAAAPGFIITLVALLPLLRGVGKRAAWILLPAFCVCLTMVPSALDAVDKMANPTPKPAYVIASEMKQPAPLPWFGRMAEMTRASVDNSSDVTWPGLIRFLPDSQFWVMRAYDSVIMLLIIGGVVSCLLAVRRQSRRNGLRGSPAALILLLWIFLPPLMGAIFLKTPNVSYFAVCMPAVWMSVLFFPEMKHLRFARAGRLLPALLLGCVFAGGAAVSGALIATIVKADEYITGYYQPYEKQLRVAKYVTQHGIEWDHVQHLGGPVFAEPYRYLVRYVDGRGSTQSGRAAGGQYALLQDAYFLQEQPARQKHLVAAGAVKVGPVVVLVLPSRGAAEVFTRQYYEVP
jgi:hypothetical protein